MVRRAPRDPPGRSRGEAAIPERRCDSCEETSKSLVLGPHPAPRVATGRAPSNPRTAASRSKPDNRARPSRRWCSAPEPYRASLTRSRRARPRNRPCYLRLRTVESRAECPLGWGVQYSPQSRSLGRRFVALRRGGGMGRRGGLRSHRPRGRAGSSPVPGTTLASLADVKSTRRHP